MSRVELKENAKKQINGKIGLLFLMSLIVAAISAFCTAIPGAGTIASFIISPIFSFSLISIYVKISRGNTIEISNIFDGFKNIGNVWVTSFLVGLYTFLWSLLFIIPGIVKSFSYSMSLYILNDNPEISAGEAIERSVKMMNGHKMELFVLGLSFVGWAFVGVFTFGILYIWLIPYIQTTTANFYNSISGQQFNNTENVGI